MSNLDFPISPIDGQTYTSGTTTWTYNTGFGVWNITSSGPSGYTGSQGPVAGSNNQVVFNDGGFANGSPNFTFDKSTNQLSVTGNTVISGNLTLTGGIIANGSIGNAGQALVSNGSVAYWGASAGGSGSSVFTSITPPLDPQDGNLWWDEEAGQLRIYYVDGDSGQWVDATSSAIGPVGPPGPVAGSNNQVVFNDSGSANGSSGFTFTKSTNALYVGGPIASYNVFDPVVVNDISNQFDGSKTIFDLKLNQDYITAVGDSKDLEVIVNGARIAPYIQEIRWPWHTPYDSFQGFRALSNVLGPNTVKLVLYNPPVAGDSASIIVRTRSSSQQQNKYPFTALTISLGD